MSRYRTILFDADNTLFDFTRAEAEAIADTLAAFGIEPTAGRCALYSRINDAMWKSLERGEISKDALRTKRFVLLCQELGVTRDAEKMSVAYTDFLASKPYLLKGALSLVRELAKVCRLYIITNGVGTVQTRRFEASALKPYFGGVFISEIIGHEKPSPAYFEAVARRIADFDPATTLVVGDSLSSDIAGGIAAGLDTCWYNPTKKSAPAGLAITHTVDTLEAILPLVLS